MSRVMKNSGVDWLGQIPAHWNLKRAKFVFKQSSSKGNSRLVLLSATQDRGVVDKSTLEGVVQVAESADLNTFKTVHINDFVISLRSFQGGFEISHCEGVISPAYTVFRLREGDYVEYYKHLFKSIGFIDKINSLTVGIREGKNIQYEDFSNMIIPVLPISEQQTIADFLDKKCGEIDEMVSLQGKIIEELKAYKQSVITETVCKGLNPDVPMKDSGIEWIGQIPKGWVVSSLGSLSNSLRNGYVGPTRDIFVMEGIRYLQSLHIKEGEICFNKHEYFVSKDWGDKHPKVHTGDILIVQTGDIGQVGLVSTEYDECNCHALIILTPRDKVVIPRFLTYYLRSSIGKELLLQKKTGALLPHLNSGRIGSVPVILPNKEEQLAISDYLDIRCSGIDTLISLKQSKIDALKEYKKSIIYEYITGKKEVPYEEWFIE